MVVIPRVLHLAAEAIRAIPQVIPRAIPQEAPLAAVAAAAAGIRGDGSY